MRRSEVPEEKVLPADQPEDPPGDLAATEERGMRSIQCFKGRNFDEALAWQMKAVAIKERLAPDSTKLAVTYRNIGSIYDARGQLDEALA